MTTKQINELGRRIIAKYGVPNIWETVKLTTADSHGDYSVDERQFAKHKTGWHYLVAVSHKVILRVRWEDLWQHYLENKERESKLNGPVKVFPLSLYEVVTPIKDEDIKPYIQHKHQQQLELDKQHGQENLFDKLTGEIL